MGKHGNYLQMLNQHSRQCNGDTHHVKVKKFKHVLPQKSLSIFFGIRKGLIDFKE